MPRHPTSGFGTSLIGAYRRERYFSRAEVPLLSPLLMFKGQSFIRQFVEMLPCQEL
ncbi:Conserved hypothetical protein [Prochlorococcus marinus str. MIT 9303]|uniref:Uncharacterized protein n=1 Tax=Prochlorococcus marinus (strain MIT 9303) TaxID=59922 RepID=A2CCQ7_PROM3|nr:Conserved hypothetical protein [Prochlorococcus marinus str. MIT 9303]